LRQEQAAPVELLVVLLEEVVEVWGHVQVQQRQELLQLHK
jgi:hypothetical protein